MKKVRFLIVVHFLVTLYYTLVFTKSLVDADTLTSGVNFLLLAAIALACFGIGWLNLLRSIPGNQFPYDEVHTGAFKSQMRMVKMHVAIIISSIVYLNIFLATVAMLLVTDTFHYLGTLAPFGFFISRKLATCYLAAKQKQWLLSESERQSSV